jgi:hypothetical protein
MKTILAIVATIGIIVYFQNLEPKSQEEIAISKMQDGIDYIKKGDMMMACLTLTDAKNTFEYSVPGGKEQAQKMIPAVNKACSNG